MFISHTKYTQRKISGSTSFAIDNMYYVNFRIQEQESVPWCGEIQNQRLEVLGNTLNIHSNFTYAQEVWSLNQFICICSRENKKVAYTHIHIISFFYKILYASLLITDYLIGLAFWALICGLEWDQKRTNKTLVPMGFGHFCQLLTSPKLSLNIFYTTILL